MIHSPGTQTVSPAWALDSLLTQLSVLIADLPRDVYCRRFATQSGSVGEHVRHCLDHVAALLKADVVETLSYDSRERGTVAETDPEEAVRLITRLRSEIETWPRQSLAEPIRVTSMLSPEGESVTGWSTLARELAFVVNHTIHHHALIGVLLASRGYAVPERFGLAPSTPTRH